MLIFVTPRHSSQTWRGPRTTISQEMIENACEKYVHVDFRKWKFADFKRQSSAINTSLTTLGKVVDALNVIAQKGGDGTGVFVPYRESKLTRHLQGVYRSIILED